MGTTVRCGWCDHLVDSEQVCFCQRSKEPDQATKFDDDKPRVDLFPPEALFGISEILGIGAKKYGPRNWEKGMDWGRAYAANMRHLLAWWGGQDNDPETGKNHLWHAGCNNAFLIAYVARGVGTDTRSGR